MGGNPVSASGLVSLSYAAGATDTGHEGGSGSFALGTRESLPKETACCHISVMAG